MDKKLKTKVVFEISQIEKLIIDSKPLINLCESKIPDYIEISAAALLLHSFYNGIENILILILKDYNEDKSEGSKWHIELLNKAFASNQNRKQVFKLELKESLKEYLRFRHFIRHAYGFQLEWSMMENLVKRIESIWNEAKENINDFINL